MITNVQECIKPISYIKTNAADMMNFVNDRKEPLVITQNGESRAVLMDVESYQEMKNAFNLLKVIQFSEQDVKKGKYKTASEVFSNLRRKYNCENEINEVIVSQFAEDDLNEIVEYYYSLSQNYVEKVISEFEENVMSLQKHPKSGRVVPELEKQGILQYRELIQGYYRIVYEISDDKVIVHTIIDGRRNFQDIIISKLSRYYGN